MLKNFRSNLHEQHPFHMVNNSPWPLFASLALLKVVLNFIFVFDYYHSGFLGLMYSLFIFFFLQDFSSISFIFFLVTISFFIVKFYLKSCSIISTLFFSSKGLWGKDVTQAWDLILKELYCADFSAANDLSAMDKFIPFSVMRAYCQARGLSVRKLKLFLVERGLAIFGQLEYCDPSKGYRKISGFFGITFRNTVKELTDIWIVSSVKSLRGIKRTLIVPLVAEMLATQLIPPFKSGVRSPPVDGIREDIMVATKDIDIRFATKGLDEDVREALLRELIEQGGFWVKDPGQPSTRFVPLWPPNPDKKKE